MGLHETVKQVLEAYNAIAASADRAEQAAGRMEQHEQRTARLVDRIAEHERRAAARDSRGKWGRILDGALGGLIAGLVLVVALAVSGVLPPGPSADQERLEALQTTSDPSDDENGPP